jgi:hypothetical protein
VLKLVLGGKSAGIKPMLSHLSKDIAECYLRAQECNDLARLQVDPRTRQDFFDMERRWLFLARSYEFTERLERFPKPK